MLNDNERANELLNCGHEFGDCVAVASAAAVLVGVFGKRISLLWKFVSMLIGVEIDDFLSVDSVVLSIWVCFFVGILWLCVCVSVCIVDFVS